jgi:putative addiction module component (TIGR02574 family)
MRGATSTANVVPERLNTIQEVIRKMMSFIITQYISNRRKSIEDKKNRGQAEIAFIEICPLVLLKMEITMKSQLVSVFDLSPPEKLQLVEDLWDDLAVNQLEIPMHEWQKEELNRRKANLMKNPGAGLSWEQVKYNIKNRYGC